MAYICKKNYVKSKFNIFFEGTSDDYYIFNTRTNAVCKLDKTAAKLYEEFPNISSNDDLAELIATLFAQGFLVENSQIELDYIKHNLYKNRYEEKVLSLTITPTMKCNFSCDYCFETNKTFGKMDAQVISLLKLFVAKKLQSETKLQVTWFGGEPMLALDVVSELSEEFISLCKEKKCEYNANMITNGFLISHEQIPILKKNLIRSIQITLDGSEEFHNKKRFLPGGIGTYQTLIKNIKLLKEEGFGVNVRLNQEKDNINSIGEILKDFKLNGIEQVPISFGRIEPYGNMEYQKKCVDISEIAKIEIDYYKYGIRNNFENKVKLPIRLRNHCLADQVFSFVIDSKGYIYKCWSDTGNIEYAIGNLSANIISNENILVNYLKFDPTIDDECKECSVMPMCMGGCPHNRLYETRTCSNLKYNIIELVKLVVLEK